MVDRTHDGYSGAKAAEIVGITYRQLDYWLAPILSARPWSTPPAAAAAASTPTVTCSSCG